MLSRTFQRRRPFSKVEINEIQALLISSVVWYCYEHTVFSQGHSCNIGLPLVPLHFKWKLSLISVLSVCCYNYPLCVVAVGGCKVWSGVQRRCLFMHSDIKTGRPSALMYLSYFLWTAALYLGLCGKCGRCQMIFRSVSWVQSFINLFTMVTVDL